MDLKQQLWNAFKNRVPVQLLNHYQGIPVTCSAVVYLLGHDILAVQVEPRYLAVIRHEHCTYLECGECPELLKATPIAFETLESMVILGRFSVVEPEARQRHYDLRIQPRETVRVTLDCTGQEMTGRLLELQSVGNTDLHLKVTVDGLASIQRDTRVGLSLDIPGDPKVVSLSGMAGRVNRQNRLGKTNLRIQVAVEPSGDGKLSRYFMRRKEEIEADWLAA